MLEVIRQDYIRTARSKGLREQVVIYRHALRNALIPIVTVSGIQFGNLLGGTVIIESVFARAGVGRVAIDAIQQRDIPLVLGVVMFFAVIYVITNLSGGHQLRLSRSTHPLRIDGDPYVDCCQGAR